MLILNPSSQKWMGWYTQKRRLFLCSPLYRFMKSVIYTHTVFSVQKKNPTKNHEAKPLPEYRTVTCNNYKSLLNFIGLWWCPQLLFRCELRPPFKCHIPKAQHCSQSPAEQQADHSSVSRQKHLICRAQTQTSDWQDLQPTVWKGTCPHHPPQCLEQDLTPVSSYYTAPQLIKCFFKWLLDNVN